MKQAWRVSILLLLPLLWGCFREDEPVLLPPPGDVEYAQIPQGADYSRQYYFDLETGDTMGMPYASWDLCFSTDPSVMRVWINGGNQAYVAQSNAVNFADITDTSGLQWKMDAPSWNPDSTAIGAWNTHNFVYVLDRGPAFPDSLRFFKFRIVGFIASGFLISVAELYAPYEIQLVIQIMPDRAYAYFAFNQVAPFPFVEPPSENWDLLFTRYRHVFTDQQPPLPYVVTGVLINPNIMVAVDSTLAFEDITYDEAVKLTYTNRRNVIGYNWKYFDFAAQAFVVRPYINYIIRDTKGIYWKLRFIDFYNDDGVKGYPAFEYQRL